MNYSDFLQDSTSFYPVPRVNESTLLIPEKIVWLPYFSIVMTVLCWLGYDFYRFHQKTRMKQARVKEQRTIMKLCPGRQRISMVSGIGLKFKRGKPIIGDVWNTSPSSSDLSSCGTSIRHGRNYSREVTPSDEGGCGYSEGETFPLRNTGSYVDVAGPPDERDEEHKGWEIGGEYVEGISTGKSCKVNSDTSSTNGRKHSPDLSPGDSHPATHAPKDTASGSDTPTPFTVLTPSVADNIATDRLFKVFRVGGGVDDGGGGSGQSDTSGSQDAVTQTDFEDVYFNMTTGERVNYPFKSSYHTYPPPNNNNSSGGGGTVSRRRESVDVASSVATPSPFVGLLNHCDQPVVIDMTRPRLSRDETIGAASLKHLGKRRPSLRIDLLASPHSPTTELVAQDHGFALEGLEVPHYSGGARSLPSSGSDIFKPKDSRKNSHASIKPLSPSPAIMTRINVTQEDTPPLRPHYGHLHHHHQHYHHHRQRRPESLDFMFGNPSVKPQSKKKYASSSHHSKHSRAVSLSPDAAKDQEKQPAVSTLKVPTSAPEARTAPIPSHLYHQDEEGFFSSSHSSGYNPGRTFAQDGDSSRRGILFFSRLSGAGRVSSSVGFDSSVGSGSSAMYGLGKTSAYKSGGFES